ncbi:centrosome-associated protein CEP250 isoform X5 [Manihot esculenta]|uniref:centrosome-associated protein CEP250 isoform X5 n=1 Tax=Manihot esculenta TaxID=3983 RepID=UPI001CC638AB|nr:centrosome-associated protein CEP250 isoform X5 [Manihot esculenta]
MAGIDPQRQLLNLIRDCTSEKSQGERRVVGLRKRVEELRSELEAANAELEGTKRFKETTEQDLKGYEVELAMNIATIHTLEGRISQIQDEISSIGSEVERLKHEERTARDAFICQMFELNTRIRNFQNRIASNFYEANNVGSAEEADQKVLMEVPMETDSRALEDELALLVSQITKEEQEYLAEQSFQKQVQQEYVDLQRKVSLMEVITKETKALQDLIRQTSELEQIYASLGEQLQKKCVCPGCQTDNVESLRGIFQADEQIHLV